MDASSPLVLRLFISSPGDVGVERDRAADVVKRLQEEFVNYAELRPYFWEDEPALATATFQDQIPPPSQMDIVVGILWARIGTRLPPDRKKPDGTPYASGTEYELEDAARGYRERRSPDLVVYRKTSPPPIPLDDGDERRRRLEQLDALEDLIRRWFFHQDGSFRAAFNTFKTADEFERQLEAHLRVLIRQKIEQAERPDGHAAGEIVFHGSPYRGLRPFDQNDAAVFYGRRAAVAAVKEAMTEQAARGCAFLLIFGMSGSGKSSLVRAGLLHGLAESPGFVPGVDLWRVCVVRPADAGGEPLDGLAQALFGDRALPELRATGLDAARLARTLRENPRDIDLALRPALRAAAEAWKARKQAERPPEARLVVFVDQMEEVFTQERLDDDRRAGFVAALSALARSGLAWVVATMRSDFYHRCAELPELVALKADRGQYDLAQPTFAEIGQMIRYPARDAGLRWGKDPADPGRSLDDVLQEAAWRDPKALPLLQFTLGELFLRRAEGRTLTFAEYDQMGGLEGALARRAEGELARLGPEAQAALPGLLRALVTVGQGDDDPVVARRADLDPLRADPVRSALLDVLIGARLLVTDRADDGRPVVGVAHEALLTGWPRLNDLLKTDREFLRTRARVAAAAAHWRKGNRHRDDLLPEGKPLAEARDLLARRPEDIDAGMGEYVAASAEFRTRLRRRRVRSVATLGGVFCLVVTTFAAVSYVEWRAAEREKKLALREKATAERQKDLAFKAIKRLTYDIPERFKNVPGTIPIVRKIYEENIGMLDAILELDPDTRKAQREKATNFSFIGDRWVLLGDPRRAIEAYNKGLTIARRLAADEGDSAAQRDLSLYYDRVGDVLHASGDLTGSRDAYAKGMAIARRLAQGGGVVAQRDLSVGYFKLGDVLQTSADLAGARVAYEKGLEIMRGLSRADGGDAAQRDLSVGYFKLGDVLQTSADLAGARDAYEKGLVIRRKLAGDEGNLQAQRDLSVSYERLGDLAQQSGDLPAARDAYTKSMLIRRKLAEDKANAVAQTNLAISHDKLGDLALRAGDTAAARDAYTKSMVIRRELAGDEGNAEAQRNLSISHDKYGDLALRTGDHAGARLAYEKSMAIARRLAVDEGNAVAQRDLAVGYSKLGDLAQQSGDLPAARDDYEKGLAITRRLAMDKGNAVAQRDLAVAYGRLGDLARQTGDLPAARDAYEKGLAVAQRLTRGEGDAVEQGALARGYDKLGDVLRATADPAGARDAYARGLAIRLRLAGDGSNAQARRALLASYTKAAGVCLDEADLAGAREQYSRGLAVCERSVRDHPGDIALATSLALFSLSLAELDAAEGKSTAAIDRCSRAIRALDVFPLPKEPVSMFKAALRANCLLRAKALVQSGRDGESIKDWTRAIELFDPGYGDPHRMQRAMALARIGDHARATADANEVADRSPRNGEILNQAGYVFSLASSAVTRDEKLPEAERGTRADQLAGRAVALLMKARDAGAFPDRVSLGVLKKDAGLDPLRARPDFQTLLTDLEAAAATRTPIKSP